MRFKKIVNMFKAGNVAVAGKRGRGKDMLTANVIVRRKKPYISNIDYGGEHFPFEYDKIAVAGNTYRDFVSGNLKKYVFPYPDGTDLYLSDTGVYFPAHYCNELNRDFKSLPTFFALSRHLGKSNAHSNSQSLSRCWDKLREQGDQYIVCLRCYVILGIVLQRVAIYDKYESACQVMPRLRLPKPLIESKREKLARRTAEEMYKAQHGEIKFAWLLYRNKSKYDTRAFKKMLEEGKE